MKPILGSDCSGPVGHGEKVNKATAFKLLGSAIQKCCPEGSWNPENSASRWKSYLKTYKKTKAASLRTGFGVTDDDMTKKITTVKEKAFLFISAECNVSIF